MTMNRLIAPPVPAGVEQDHHFAVQVRPVGTDTWVDVPTYAAWVDMHDVRQTAVSIFDFIGPVEVRLRPPCVLDSQCDCAPAVSGDRGSM